MTRLSSTLARGLSLTALAAALGLVPGTASAQFVCGTANPGGVIVTPSDPIPVPLGGVSALSARSLASTTPARDQTSDPNGQIAWYDSSMVCGLNAAVRGRDSTAVGNGAQTTADNSGATAVGAGAVAGSQFSFEGGFYTNTTAVGYQARATEFDATAIGAGAVASDFSTTSVGSGASATNFNATATGTSTTASGANSSAYGANARAGFKGGDTPIDTPQLQALDATDPSTTPAVATTSDNATAIGQGAQAGTVAGQDNATAVGQGARANALNATAIGQGSFASGESATVVGQNAGAIGNRSVVVGAGALDLGNANSVAIGAGASVGDPSIYASRVDGLNVALGTDSMALRGAKYQYQAYGLENRQNSIGEVAVGTANGNRQITGVAAGSEDYDAVNVLQLRSTVQGISAGSGGPIAGENALGGAFPVATGANSTAAGWGAVASADNSVAIGAGSLAARANTVSFGVPGGERVLVNVAAGTQATDAVNVGQLNAMGTRVGNVELLMQNLPTAPVASVPVSANAATTAAAPTSAGTNALAVGYGASAPAANSVALGNGSVATQANTVSIGAVGAERRLANVADAVDLTDGVNLGQMRSAIAALPEAAYVPVATNNASENLPKPTAGGVSALGVGYGANAGGASSVAIGKASASGDQATAIGRDSSASGAQSLAAGAGSQATGASSAALGARAKALGELSVAGGADSTASGARSAAYGANSTASAADSTAVGPGATAAHAGATAIGAGARTTRANQVAVGTSRSTYTLGGVASAESRAAQSGPTFFATTDAQGNLAATTFDTSRLDVMDTRINGVEGRVAGVENRMTSVERRVGNLEGDVYALRKDVRRTGEGVSIAMAMAGVQLPAGKNYALSANWGTFEGENGFAATGAARISDSTIVHAGIGVGANRGTVGARAGVTFGW